MRLIANFGLRRSTALGAARLSSPQALSQPKGISDCAISNRFPQGSADLRLTIPGDQQVGRARR